MSEKRYLWDQAFTVAADICNRLRPGCVRIEIAGSLRREKEDVGDIEILYIPVVREAEDPRDFFATVMVDCAEVRIRAMEASGILARRLNTSGRQTYGPLNKLMLHVPSGIPVDLFAATPENWFNYLVCRTGPSELNVRICEAAIKKGWKWNPYGIGFTRADGQVIHASNTEREVFEFVGLPYREPARRT